MNKNLYRFIPAVIWTVIILFLCLMPADDMPESPFFNIPHFDKLVHAGLYFILALLMFRPLKKLTLPVFLPVLAFSFFLGGAVELLQQFCTNSRSGSWIDLLADVTGAVAGIMVWRLYNSKVSMK